jgi:hypothetical protein
MHGSFRIACRGHGRQHDLASATAAVAIELAIFATALTPFLADSLKWTSSQSTGLTQSIAGLLKEELTLMGRRPKWHASIWRHHHIRQSKIIALEQ